MNRFLENATVHVTLCLLFAAAILLNGLTGGCLPPFGASPLFPAMAWHGVLNTAIYDYPREVAIGPTFPPSPWGEGIAIGPTFPPNPWDEGIAIGPTFPPNPWDEGIAIGPTFPPNPWDEGIAIGPTFPPNPWDEGAVGMKA